MVPRLIQRGVVTFKLYAKSIQVVTQHGHPLIYLCREPDDSDVDFLCTMLDMGAAMQMQHVRDSLTEPRKMPRT